MAQQVIYPLSGRHPSPARQRARENAQANRRWPRPSGRVPSPVLSSEFLVVTATRAAGRRATRSTTRRSAERSRPAHKRLTRAPVPQSDRALAVLDEARGELRRADNGDWRGPTPFEWPSGVIAPVFQPPAASSTTRPGMPLKSLALRLTSVARRAAAVTPIATSAARRRGEPSWRKTSAALAAKSSSKATTLPSPRNARAVATCSGVLGPRQNSNHATALTSIVSRDAASSSSRRRSGPRSPRPTPRSPCPDGTSKTFVLILQAGNLFFRVMAFKQVEQPIEHVHAPLATVSRDTECRIAMAQNSATDRLRRRTTVALCEFPGSFPNLIVQNKRGSMRHTIWRLLVVQHMAS